MQPKTIEWFEIMVTDLPRAIQFYQQVLDRPLRRETHQDMEMAIFNYADGTTGGALVPHQAYPNCKVTSGNNIVIYLGVPTIDEALERVAQAGGKIAFPCTSIGENGFIAGMIDLDGNIIGLHAWQA